MSSNQRHDSCAHSIYTTEPSFSYSHHEFFMEILIGRETRLNTKKKKQEKTRKGKVLLCLCTPKSISLHCRLQYIGAIEWYDDMSHIIMLIRYYKTNIPVFSLGQGNAVCVCLRTKNGKWKRQTNKIQGAMHTHSPCFDIIHRDRERWTMMRAWDTYVHKSREKFMAIRG